MDIYITEPGGAQYALPPLFSWRVSRGCGEACDDFDCSFAYHASQDAILPRAARVSAFHQGKQVFCGLPDEWTVSQDARGRSARLWGRGLQALLMDDQAEPAHFTRAGWRDIVARYVTPKGIAIEDDVLPSFADFHVESGMSLWQAVTAFARDHAGRWPRFSAGGRLLVGALVSTAARTLELPARGVSAICTLNRYGVVAEILVRNRDTLSSYTVKNTAFPGPGGRRQVVTGVGREGVAQMEQNARRTMKQSLRNYQTVSVTLPWAFAAEPGEALTLSGAPDFFGGVYVVWEAESACGLGSGETTRLVLIPSEYLQ